MPPPRLQARAVAQFLLWAGNAPAREMMQYHTGNLATDRVMDGNIARLAETALVMAQGDYVVLSQIQIPNDEFGRNAYTATRTGTGYTPAAILSGELDARDYRALRLIQTRPADLSAARVLRHGLACPEQIAISVLEELKRKDLVASERERGWKLTEHAQKLMI